ncbi:hypothetical protein JTB14_008007 [Gonioctena quinquepunctata]|nr:hypothetical protein JTB14_008007 [Gonioctena quinquepunctata]
MSLQLVNVKRKRLNEKLDDKNVVHPLGPSEAENAAEEGGPGHDTSNISSASLKSDKNDERLDKKVLAKTINENNNAQGSKDVFAKPKLMRRRSRIVRAPEDDNKSTTSDSRYQSSEIEEAKAQGAKTNKRKRNSPQHWDEKTRHREEMQKQKISSSNKQCECGGTMENHKFLYSTDHTAQKIKCAGSIRMKEIEYACEFMNEVDYENVRIAIDQQIMGGFESQYQKEHELKKAEEENLMDTGTNQVQGENHKSARDKDQNSKGGKDSKSNQLHNEEGKTKTEKEVPNQVKDIHIDLIRYNLEKEKEKEEKAGRERIRKERKKEEEQSERSESEKDKGKEEKPEKFESQKYAEAKEKEKKKKKLTKVSEKDKQEAGPSKSKEVASKTPKIQPEMKMDRELPRQRNTHKYGHMSKGFAALMEATHKLNYLESDIRREAQKWTKKTTEELEMEHIKKKDFIPYATIAQAIHDVTYKYWIDKLTEKRKHEMEEYKVKIHILAESAKEEEALPPKIDGVKITQVNKEAGKLLNKRKDYPKAI